MSTDESAIKSSLIGLQKAANAASDQLDERSIGITVGQGLSPPYPPDRLASLQEINGTHAVAIAKKAQREVGYDFTIVKHERADEPSDDEQERVQDFWRGRETTWKLGPKGTPAATPTEIFEKARQDYYGVGWLAIEVLYAGYDDEPAGLSYLPAKTVRVKKALDAGRDEQVAGHGYVQKRDGKTRFFGEAGDRQATDIDENSDPTFVDRESGRVYDSAEALRNDGGEPANEILFIPNPHPNTLYYGIPTWIAEMQTMVADQEARRFNRERLANDMILDYVVIVEGGQLSESSRQEIREHIQGMRDSDGPSAWILEPSDLADADLNLDEDVTIRIEPMTEFSDEDMSWTEFHEMNEHTIAQAHEVPRQMLGRQDATNANTQEAIRSFVEETVAPAQERFSKRLYRVIHQRILGVNDWTIDFETVGLRDRSREADLVKSIMRSTGQALEINEARALADSVLDQDIGAIDELDGELYGVLSDPILADELATAFEDA